ncbi:MAG TPA: fluoride efflux transporter CrcB [Thermoanaerobaculia bacterium]|nr:fluoride efflux transporter CrcB [Thermoanaerobaculia bacterium]
MKSLLLVGAGGFAGAVARWLLAGWAGRLLPAFPWGTLLVNGLGCFAIGMAAGWAELRGGAAEEVRLAMVVGLLGGFTTFSSFGYETFELAREGRMLPAAANVLLQVTLGLAAVWAGDRLFHEL